MNNAFFRSTLALILGSTLLISYQNCAGGFSEFGSLQKNTHRSEFPFPLKTESDYFGFMSCSGLNNPSPDPDYFSFRLMSDSNSGKGGIGLAEDFMSSVRAEEAKHPNLFDIRTETLRALQESTKLSGARIQMSVLYRNQLTAKVVSDRILFANIYDSIPLDSENMMETLSFKHNGDTVVGQDFVTSIDWRNYSLTAFSDLMKKMSTEFALGLNYSASRGNYGEYLRSPLEYQEDYGGLYGRLFDLSFSNNKISYLVEKDAKLSANGHSTLYDKNWSCSELKIVRPSSQDISDSLCLNPGESFQSLSQSYNPSDGKQRALLSLLGDSWLINRGKDCIIHKSYNSSQPKRGCYGGDNLSIPVNYGPFNINLGSSRMNAHRITVCWVN